MEASEKRTNTNENEQLTEMWGKKRERDKRILKTKEKFISESRNLQKEFKGFS